MSVCEERDGDLDAQSDPPEIVLALQGAYDG